MQVAQQVIRAAPVAVAQPILRAAPVAVARAPEPVSFIFLKKSSEHISEKLSKHLTAIVLPTCTVRPQPSI